MTKRGRPTGFRLSEESKRSISESKKGQKHKQETKDKISRTLRFRFKDFNSLSEEIINRYCRSDDDDLCDWANDVREELDLSKDVFTNKTMNNTRRMELTCGDNIEFFSHSLTPELIYMIRELLEDDSLDVEDILEDLYRG